MKIGYDGKRAMMNMTGLGNYSRLVIESVGRKFPDDTLRVYTPAMRDNVRLAEINKLRNVEWVLPTRGASRAGKGAWRTWGITRQLTTDCLDIYHGLSNELPLNIKRSDVASVVTIHDVIYRRLPHSYKLIDRLLYDKKYGRSCRNADRIIAISECTKRDIVEFYGVDPEKIDVIYQGCDDIFKRIAGTAELEAVRERYQLPERYVVQVGSIEERKNAELTVKSIHAWPKDVKLLLVGRKTDYLDRVLKTANALGVAERVEVRSNIAYADLPLVYQAAECTVYPSRYEGFGLPVLEAVTCGLPVVAATGSCLEEAGGRGALYVNPDDADAMGEALRSILYGEIDLAEMRTEGERHASQFSNADIATRVRTVYEKTLRQR